MSEHHVYTTGVPVAAHDALSSSEHFLMMDFLTRLKAAEEKHPVFAEGPYQALGIVAEECGEVAKCITKDAGEERLYDEALDLLVVTWRLARGDWKDWE